MNKTNSVILTDTKKNILLKIFFLLYPLPYRRRFENEMLLVFNDMYQEELTQYGRIRMFFWFSQIIDLLKSIIEQHKEFAIKYGFKKYVKNILHVNKYNVLGVIFLLPFASMFLIDLSSRILQGDLNHPNPSVLHGIYNTPLYWAPILFMWVILFPILAVITNVIPLLANLLKRRKQAFIEKNIVNIVILLAGISVIALIELHDFTPCFIHHIIIQGFTNFGNTIEVCKNA